MPILRRQNAGGGVLLTDSAADILTFNSGLAAAGAIIQKVVLINKNTTTVRICTVWFKEPAGSDSDPRLIGIVKVPPEATEELVGPFYGTASSVVRAKQDTGSDVVCQVVAIEVT